MIILLVLSSFRPDLPLLTCKIILAWQKYIYIKINNINKCFGQEPITFNTYIFDLIDQNPTGATKSYLTLWINKTLFCTYVIVTIMTNMSEMNYCFSALRKQKRKQKCMLHSPACSMHRHASVCLFKVWLIKFKVKYMKLRENNCFDTQTNSTYLHFHHIKCNIRCKNTWCCLQESFKRKKKGFTLWVKKLFLTYREVPILCISTLQCSISSSQRWQQILLNLIMT